MIEVAVNEEDPDVAYTIRKKLEKEKDTEDIKENMSKLINAKYWEIRVFSIRFLSENELIEMVVNEENSSAVYEIIGILMSIKRKSGWIKKNAYKLVKAKSGIIRKSIVEFLVKDELIEMLINEKIHM